MTQTLPPKFDAFDPEVLDDPYPVYARLRAAGALCRGGPATWVVTRHAEVSALLKDRRLGHTFPEGFRTPFAESGGAANRLLQRIVSSLDPPDHTRVRRGVAQAVNPAVVRGMREGIAARVDALLHKDGSFDAITDLVLPLQIGVGCDLIGVPAADRDDVWPRAVAIGRAFIPMAVGDSGPADDGAADWLGGYVRELVERRRREPGDDVVSRMLTGSLSDDEIVDNTVFLFFAGFETAMYLVAGGCVALARNPAQQQRLRADPTLLPYAVEEIVRFDAPIQSMARMVVEPIEIDGRTVKAGRALVLLIGSANHDERVFAEPERFDVGRHPNPHLGFGGGAHHCLGVGLARLEGEVVFERLLRRYTTIEPDGEPVRRPHPNLRGYASVPLRVG